MSEIPDTESIFKNAQKIFDGETAVIETIDNGILIAINDKHMTLSLSALTTDGNSTMTMISTMGTTIVSIDIFQTDEKTIIEFVDIVKKLKDKFTNENIEDFMADIYEAESADDIMTEARQWMQ